MSTVSSCLLKDWALLRDEVVPPLLAAGRQRRVPTAWSLAGVADAVAVVAAYREAGREFPRDRRSTTPALRAFASAEPRELSPVSFSPSDIRQVPARSRADSFERHDRRWVAGEEVSRSIYLAEPDQPVDLIVLPAAASEERSDSAIQMLRHGGRLVLVGPPGPAGDACRDGLDVVDRHRGLYAKGSRSQAAPAVAEAAGPDPASSLAAHQRHSELVAAHLRLARSLARTFAHRGESSDDLEQVALMALVKAARRYDPSREISFSTYATASIVGEIKRHFRDKTWTMRVPRSVQENYLAVKEARETLTHQLAHSPTIAQIATRVGVSDEAVLEAMEAGDNYWPESLDVGVFEGEAGREVAVTDTGFDLALDRHHLAALVGRLAPEERLLLERLFFDNATQREVAEELGVSQMQVSRLLHRLLDKLRSRAA